MQGISANEYESIIEEWRDWQSYPWAGLMYRLSRYNLERHLDGRSLRILDVGGGNGTNTLYFARLGYTVTLVDYSPSLLAEAEQAARKAGVLDQISFIQGDAADLPGLLQGQQFDLALCHLVIGFLAEPERVIGDICKLVIPGGLVSILEGNRYSEVYRQALQVHDLEEAARRIGTRTYFHPWFNRQIWLYSGAEVAAMVGASGCELLGNYGVRCLNDYLPNELKQDPVFFERLERLEQQLGEIHPYSLLARFYQVIARKK